MPELDKLGLSEDAAPQVDWDAPPPGMIPPPVTPGTWLLRLEMPEAHEDWYDVVEREVVKGNPSSKRKFLEITTVPAVIADSQSRAVANEDGTAIKLGPQRFNTFMSSKMRIHRLAELLRSCGVRIEGSLVDQIDEYLKQMNGQSTFWAEIIWRAYFKSTDTTVSTHTRGKNSGELLWPRKADGSWEEMAVNPNTGERAFGYAEVAAVKLPTSTNGNETLAAGA